MNTNPTAGVTANTSKDYMLHKDVDLANLSTTATYNSTSYNTNYVTVNLWIEGEDPESRAAQVSGKFKANLKFKMVAR